MAKQLKMKGKKKPQLCERKDAVKVPLKSVDHKNFSSVITNAIQIILTFLNPVAYLSTLYSTTILQVIQSKTKKTII